MKKCLSFVSIGMGVLAMLTAFFPAALSGPGEIFNGFDVVFGDEDMLAFSFMNFLTYLLVIVAIVCNILYLLKKKQLFSYIGVGCFFLASIFFFCTVEFIVIPDYFDGVKDIYKSGFNLGTGAILAAVLCIIGAIVSAFAAFGDKFFKNKNKE